MAPNQFVTDNITLYIPNLQRYGSGTLQETVPVQRFGVDLNMAFIGEELLEST